VDLSLIAMIVIAVVVVSLLLGLALGTMAYGADERDSKAGVLTALAAVRSPSGRPFFPDEESVQDFVKTLDDSREERTPR
jgi:hypothetical protein